MVFLDLWVWLPYGERIDMSQSTYVYIRHGIFSKPENMESLEDARSSP